MTEINKNIVRAAVLQDLAQPYSLIFVDTVLRKLYFAVCTSSPKEKLNPSFAAVSTTSGEIERYMSEEISLEDIFLTRPTVGFKISGDNVLVDYNNSFHPDQTFESMKWFDPDFCEEEGWIEEFLKRYSQGQPFEVV